MIGRVILAALLAGIAAGLIMGVIQHFRLTPLILEAETYEAAGVAAADHTHGDETATEGHDHGHGEVVWSPADGWQRSLATTVTAAMTGAAFAAVLAGISLLTSLRINSQNGVLWGLCGFLAVTLAPAIGLPPELPGMPAGELLARQVWWVGTIAATGIGILLIAIRPGRWAVALAIVLIALPHVIGPPPPVHSATAVPADLAARFAANAIAANAVFWMLIGQFLALALNRTAKELYAQ